MENSTIGIFAAAEGDTPSFFGRDDQALVAELYKHAASIVGDMGRLDPVTGMSVKRVAEVVVQPVDDQTVYKVKADEGEVDKPEGGRKPSGDAGTWTIQSLIFSKDTFNEAEAKAWISASDQFGSYGVEETETSYRYRQYDPGYFDQFRTITVEDGVSAAYGRIAPAKVDEAAAKADLEDSVRKHLAVRKINKSFLQQGVRILCKSAKTTMIKGGEVEKEERFVLSMVLEPNDGKDGAPMKPDTQNDVYSKADVRAACHVWMEYYGQIDLMHSWQALGKENVRTLECYVAPCDFALGDDQVVEGSWMLGVRIVNDDLWKAVQDEELGAFSIGGEANRVPLAAA